MVIAAGIACRQIFLPNIQFEDEVGRKVGKNPPLSHHYLLAWIP